MSLCVSTRGRKAVAGTPVADARKPGRRVKQFTRDPFNASMTDKMIGYVPVSLYSRPGNDLTYRFTLIVEALARLRSRSCIIDGEAVLR